jgi:hypothetical protein
LKTCGEVEAGLWLHPFLTSALAGVEVVGLTPGTVYLRGGRRAHLNVLARKNLSDKLFCKQKQYLLAG